MESKQFYDIVAKRHRLFYANWPATVQQEGTWLHSHLEPMGVRTVLDCTCGIGTLALGLAKQGYEVTASDFSLENLAEAQRAAQAFGVTVAWYQADVRRLENAPLAGPFDAVISLGNSLSHLLTEQDMLQALGQIHDQVRRHGLVLVGQQDWDAVRVQQPRFRFRHEHLNTPAPGRRTILFDLWHYDDPLVTFEVFFLEERDTGWHVERYPLRYRMWSRRTLIELLQEANLVDVHQVEHPWEIRLIARRS